MTLHENMSNGQLDTIILITTLSLSIRLIYFIVLLKVMLNEGPLWKKAVNVMIVTDEGIKLLASMGTLVGVILSTIWMELNEMPGSNFMGNSSICKIYIKLSFFTIWSLIGSAGML